MCIDGSTDTGKINQKLPFQVNEFDSRIGPPTQGRVCGDVRSIRMLLWRDGFFFPFAGERRGKRTSFWPVRHCDIVA